MIDVFNGDADGICALLQLRADRPAEHHQLISGVKRDVRLLRHIHPRRGEHVTVLDISLHENYDDLIRILHAGSHVLYIDHHRAGVIPSHENLSTILSTDFETCTSILTSNFLQHRQAAWAIVGAYGDNLTSQAQSLAQQAGIDDKHRAIAQQLSVILNYNSCGDTLEELTITPQKLYCTLATYSSPRAFAAGEKKLWDTLEQACLSDLAAIAGITAHYTSPTAAIYIFPDAYRKASSIYANQLSTRYPQRAHALLSRRHKGDWQVSIRTAAGKSGADQLCQQFPSGGGRATAGGINSLPDQQLDTFIKKFIAFFNEDVNTL